LANGQKALLGAHGGVRIVPLGAAHGAEQHRVGVLAGAQRVVGKRGAGGVDGRAADELLGKGQAVAAGRGDGAEDLARGGGDLRSEAVAGEEDEAGVREATLAEGRSAAGKRPYSIESTSARHEASMMLDDAPMVLHSALPSVESMRTRV